MIFLLLISQVRAIIEINEENVLNTIAIEHPFICFTLDWWPDTKISFGNASWIGTGLNNLDFENPKLIVAARTLASSQLDRIDGTKLIILVNTDCCESAGRSKIL